MYIRFKGTRLNTVLLGNDLLLMDGRSKHVQGRNRMVQAEKSGEDVKTRCIGSMYNLLNRMDLKLYRTRSNSIILYATLPAYCIPKVIMMESGEIKYEKENASSRPPPKISLKDNWRKELDSEVAGSSKDSLQIQPKSKIQLSRTERLVSEQPPVLLTKEIGKDVLFSCEKKMSC